MDKNIYTDKTKTHREYGNIGQWPCIY